MRGCADVHDWSAPKPSVCLPRATLRSQLIAAPSSAYLQGGARRVDAIVRHLRVLLRQFDLGFGRRSASPPSSSYEATTERHRGTGIALQGGCWLVSSQRGHPRIYTRTQKEARRAKGQRGARVDRQHRGGPGPCLAAFSVYGPIA